MFIKWSSLQKSVSDIVPKEFYATNPTRNPCWRGWSSTIELLVLTSLDQPLWLLKTLLLYETVYPNEEVNRTESSPSVCVPWWHSQQEFLLKLSLSSWHLFENVLIPICFIALFVQPKNTNWGKRPVQLTSSLRQLVL